MQNALHEPKNIVLAANIGIWSYFSYFSNYRRPKNCIQVSTHFKLNESLNLILNLFVRLSVVRRTDSCYTWQGSKTGAKVKNQI